MEIIQAIFLGILEGLTEFLPISSTGHLVVATDLINYRDTAKIFTVVIQLGAIAAVLWFYRRDLIAKVIGLFRRDEKIMRFWVAWVIATIPAGLLGFALKDKIDTYEKTVVVAITLIVGGIIIWLIETYHQAARASRGQADFTKISIKQALQIGLYQTTALLPGVSRSGATIMGGLLSGLDRVTATAFSFYLSIPILVLAGGYQMFKGRHELDTIAGGGTALIAGTAAAFVTALLAINWLLKYVSHHDFKLFAYYRIILGVIILVALAL